MKDFQDWILDAIMLGQGIMVLALIYIGVPILIYAALKPIIARKRNK